MSIAAASLIRELRARDLSPDRRAILSCELARRREASGNYEGARDAMAGIWSRVGERPHVEQLSRGVQAEVLLRVSALTSALGSIHRVEGAQEAAKNLLTESIELFRAEGDARRALEAQVEMGVCYWRSGGYDEARIYLGEAIRGLEVGGTVKARAVLRLAIVEEWANHYHDALHVLLDHAATFETVGHNLKGSYGNELGLIYKNLAEAEGRQDYLDRAFEHFTAALYHFEQGGHREYRARTLNNLGYLYYLSGRYAEAEEYLERARRFLVALRDRGAVAQVDETRARVLIAQGRYAEAERVARGAVEVWEKGDRPALLAEALRTHGITLARLGYHQQARTALMRAIETARVAGAGNDAGLAALAAIEELRAHLSRDETRGLYERADGWLAASQHLDTLHRLRRCASYVLSLDGETEVNDAAPVEHVAVAVVTIKDERRESYKASIKDALVRTDGSVTQAAKLLGVKYQSLQYQLRTNHQDLRHLLKPQGPRARGSSL
jgi:tetratricopeptide (TPR) repeat protein